MVASFTLNERGSLTCFLNDTETHSDILINCNGNHIVMCDSLKV